LICKPQLTLKNYLMKVFTLIVIYLIMMVSCHKTDNEAQNQDAAGGHDHGELAILSFQDGMELFAETDQLYAGHGVSIRAHLTFLDSYRPAEQGILYSRIVQGNNVPDWLPLELAQAGIFTGDIIAGDPGVCYFEFLYQEDSVEVMFTSQSLSVYTHDDIAPEGEHHDGATFTKEQAWKTEFGLLQLSPRDYKRAIHCSGEISISPGNLVDLIAPASGKISFNGSNLVEGSYVRKGSVLFTLMGTGLGQDNIALELTTARAEYEKSQANMVRKVELLKIGAISNKQYEEAKAIFDTDKTRYEILQSQVKASGIVITSPVTGYITDVFTASNAYAATGSILLKIIKEGGSLIKALVPVTEADRINSISSANFKLPYGSKIHSINDWGGKLTSVSRSVDSETGMIPVYFSISSPELIAGTFVELWLLSDVMTDQIVVPQSSLLEEYGLYYVYVQETGETYEKRLVTLSDNDGMNYLISGGLKAGEHIVSKGAMAIKIANAMGAAPVHSH